MTLDDLEVFAAVCAAQNLSSVARSRGCSQSAVSQHVRRLEVELETPLLERGTRGVTPTPAGRVLWSSALETLSALAGGRRQLEQMRRGETGSLRLATGGTTVRHFMAEAVRSFRRNHPLVTFDIQSDNATRRCLEAVRSDRADLAFVTVGPDARGIEQRPVIEVPWVFVGRRDHPLGDRRSLLPSELPGSGYVSLPTQSTSHQQLAAALASQGAHFSSTATVEDWDTAALLVELGVGWTIAPETHVPGPSSQRALVGIPVRGLPAVVFGWAARRWDALSPLAVEFAGIVGEDVAAQRACAS